MEQLAGLVRQEVIKYSVTSLMDDKSYTILDDTQKIYGAISILDATVYDRAGFIVLARVENDLVIVEADYTNKPLVGALLQVGIPREKIVLTYAGENIPSSTAK